MVVGVTVYTYLAIYPNNLICNYHKCVAAKLSSSAVPITVQTFKPGGT